MPTSELVPTMAIRTGWSCGWTAAAAATGACQTAAPCSATRSRLGPAPNSTAASPISVPRPPRVARRMPAPFPRGGSVRFLSHRNRPLDGDRLRYGELVEVDDVATDELFAILGGELAEVAGDDVARVRPGGVLVRVVARPHEQVGAEVGQGERPNRVVEEGQAQLAAHVVARPHREGEWHLASEAPVALVHADQHR